MIADLWWSGILTAVGWTGYHLISRGYRIGYWITFFDQWLWVTYSVVTGQYLFIAGAMAYEWSTIKHLRRRTPRKCTEDRERMTLQ